MGVAQQSHPTPTQPKKPHKPQTNKQKTLKKQGLYFYQNGKTFYRQISWRL